jgi:hypothetical protein
MQNDIQARVQKLKREALLLRIAAVADGDSHRWVPMGIVGQQMKLPYPDTLALTDELVEDGLVQRAGGGRLEAPIGPRVRLLPRGVEAAHRLRPERNGHAA